MMIGIDSEPKKEAESYAVPRVEISGAELLSETAEFLDRHFKGLYDKATSDFIPRRITVYPVAFSVILKNIFKCVYAKDVITVNCTNENVAMHFTLHFNTDLLTAEAKEKIRKIAKSVDMRIKEKDGAISIVFSYAMPGLASIAPKLQRIIYKSLVKYILSDN